MTETQNLNIIDNEKGIIEVETVKREIFNKDWLLQQKQGIERQISYLNEKLTSIVNILSSLN